jgi:DNA-binding CsgD family transcriptional regulator
MSKSTQFRPRSSPEQLAEREDLAYRLRLFGRSPEQIAEVIGVTPRQARRYITSARERAVAELRTQEGRAGVMRQFMVLNHVLDEALDAWERSKATQVEKTGHVEKTGLRKGGKDVDGGLATVKQRTGQKETDRIGDAVYLDKILKASAELRGLLGLDAPTIKRLLLSEDPLAKVNDEDLRTLSPEELLRRYRLTIGLGDEVEV